MGYISNFLKQFSTGENHEKLKFKTFWTLNAPPPQKKEKIKPIWTYNFDKYLIIQTYDTIFTILGSFYDEKYDIKKKTYQMWKIQILKHFLL